MTTSKYRQWLTATGVFLAWALLFALAYSQAPLFTSNQNQYFLQGLAHAGWGNLAEDALVQAKDPTPVFSFLVEWSYRLFQTELVFYIYYALLMGVYLYSIADIANHIFPYKETRTKKWVFYTLLVVLHSAFLRGIIINTVGYSWQYVLEGGLAGQRLLGAVFQPSSFGILLLLSISLFLKKRIWWAVALLPLAATIHPTYLLSAATLTAAYMWILWRKEDDFKGAVGIGALALALVSGILAYSLTVFVSKAPALFAETRSILVNFRIPHHAVIAEWFDLTSITQLILFAVGLWLARKDRLFIILLFSSIVVLGGTGLQVFLQNDNLALLFPWRLSVFIIPISTALITAFLLNQLWRFWPLAFNWTVGLCVTILISLSVFGTWHFINEVQNKLNAPERALMEYVAETHIPNEKYLVPLDWQDFRLITGAPVVTEFKSIPYYEADVDHWHHRVRMVGKFYREGKSKENCGILYDQIYRRYKARYAVIPADNPNLLCPGMDLVFDGGAYLLYSLDPDDYNNQ